jgi:hypothetical protein
MDELRSKLNKHLADAADYDLIAQLATDPERRDAFRVLAAQTRDIADKLQRLIFSGETG